MKTTGKIKISIPAVVDPNGQVSAGYYTDERGNSTTDVGVLYDHWYGYDADQPLQLIHIKATIDLDAVFASHEVEGTVEPGATA